MHMNNKFTKQQAESKIFELTQDLLRIRQEKKDMAAGYREKLKAIEEEIQAIVDEQHDLDNP